MRSILILSLFAIAFAGLACADETADKHGVLNAAIVDQLSLTEPNPDFVRSATRMLESAGYAVDYFPGERVTVDFYRELPGLGYEMVVFRAHSGLVQGGEGDGDAFLFTSEPYSREEHAGDQRARRLIDAALSSDLAEPSIPLADLPRYFGIGPEFIRSGVSGDFDGALLVVMGCNGLSSDTLAEAFVGRGAGEVTSWDGLVSAGHTDEATERLLELVLADGVALDTAVGRVRAELGPDPFYGSSLLSYTPDE